jgi:hypothetical protein
MVHHLEEKERESNDEVGENGGRSGGNYIESFQG